MFNTSLCVLVNLSVALISLMIEGTLTPNSWVDGDWGPFCEVDPPPSVCKYYCYLNKTADRRHTNTQNHGWIGCGVLFVEFDPPSPLVCKY